jgi:uncharacterized protein (AIM24 family)
MFFAGGFGTLERHEIPWGKRLLVDNGLFFAAHERTPIGITVVGNIVSFGCSGEGLVMYFNGPAVVYTKSRDDAIFKRNVEQQQNNQGGGGGFDVGVGGGF